MGKDVAKRMEQKELEKLVLHPGFPEICEIKASEDGQYNVVACIDSTDVCIIQHNVVARIDSTDVCINQKAKCHCVDQRMLSSKVAYFFKMGKFAMNEYIMLFYVNTGLSPSEAGMINGLYNLGGMFGAPLWGFLADKLKVHRLLCIILGIIALLTMSCQPLLTADLGKRNVCRMKINDTANILHPEISTQDHKKLYYGLLATSIIASSFDGGVMNFVDSGVIHHVQLSEIRCEYGHQRYIGAFGSAIGSLAMCLSITYFPQGYLSCYNGIYIAHFIFSIFLLFSCNHLLKGSSFKENNNSQEDIKGHLWSTLKKLDTIVVLLNILFHGIVQALTFSMLYLYLKDLNAPTFLFGISMSLCSTASAFVFYLSKQLIALLNGTMNAMCISCFFWSARCLAIAFLENPYYVLLADLLHGVSYSLFIICAMEHIKDISHPSIVSTMTGIVNGLYNYLSYGIASMIGGSIYQVYGGRVMFVMTSIACLVWSVLMLIYILIRKQQTTNNRLYRV